MNDTRIVLLGSAENLTATKTTINLFVYSRLSSNTVLGQVQIESRLDKKLQTHAAAFIHLIQEEFTQ